MNWLQLRADSRYLVGATSGTYPDADVMRNMGIEYQRVATEIWKSDPTHSWDDRNNTDYNTATRSMANASASYLIPTEALAIRGVEVKDGDGNWSKLSPISYAELPISPEEYLTGTGTPIRYMIEGTQVRLFPAPGTGSVTMTSGLAYHVSRAVTEPAVTASSSSPGFATPFHRVLSYAAAIDFDQDDQHRNFLIAQKARLDNGLSKFYSNWAPQYKPKLRPATKRSWRLFT